MGFARPEVSPRRTGSSPAQAPIPQQASFPDPQDEVEQLRREVDQLRRAHAEAREQSLRDGLTASYNRRYLEARLADLGVPGTAVAMVDLDLFKLVNDTHGHLLGDRVLQRLVELLCDGLPAGAFCARYGGEEFVLVLPGVDSAAAVAICEAVRVRVEHHRWEEIVAGLRVTVSIGVAHEDGPTAAQRLATADELLYAAKQSGRNAVAYRDGGSVALAGRPAAHSSRGS